MPFQVMKPPKYPRRFWFLYGLPDVGKSTFLAQLAQPLLVVDADNRFGEVLRDFPTLQAFALSDKPSDNTDSDRIAALLDENMPGSGVQTIAIDSATTIIAPHVTQAILDKDHGRIKSLSAGFKDKAMVTRQIQDAVTKWGVDNIWIYHLYEASDESANKRMRASLPDTELARLVRSSSMQIKLFKKGGRYGDEVTWARRGRSGMTLWDNTGNWVGMPAAIEAAVYDGLSQEEQERLRREPPAVFPNVATAIAWGFDQGVFRDVAHAKNAYNKIKTEESPKTAKQMRDLWVADVQSRIADKAAGKPAENGTPENENGTAGNGHVEEQEELPF